MKANKNTKLKKDYEDNYKYSNIIRLLFTKAIDFEQEYDKDLAEFDLDQIKTYLTHIGCGNADTLFAYVSTIRGYARYYAEKTGADTMAWEQATTDFVKPCVRTEGVFRYIPPVELEEVLDLIPNAADKFIIRGLYEGLKGDYYEEIWALKLRDIDPVTLVAKLPTGRKLQISPELYTLAQEATDTEDYISLKGGSNWMNYKMVGDRIIKYRPNSVKADNPPSQKIKIANRLFDMKKYTGRDEINAVWLRKSGAIYMIKKEAARLNIKETEVIDHSVFNTIRERYGLKSSTTAYKVRFSQFLNN